MGMSEELTHAIFSHKIFSFNLFGFEIPVTDTVIVTWLIMLMITVLAIILTRKMTVVPSKKQSIAEMFVEFINNMAKDSIGHLAKHFTAYLGTVLLFILLANIASIFNFIPSLEIFHEFNIRPPTKDIAVPAALTTMTLVMMIGAGVRFKNPIGYIKSFFKPMAFMFPVKVMEYGIRPISLCLRLFGNILGSFIVMELIYLAMPQIIPAAFSIYFDFFDGGLQAYVFVFLTSIYIGEVVE